MKLIIGTVIISFVMLSLAACGGSDTTTVVTQPAETSTSTSTSTTTEADTEWPQYLQDSFIKGCGTNADCYCALDKLMEEIPADELDVSAGIAKRYHDEMVQAVTDCL